MTSRGPSLLCRLSRLSLSQVNELIGVIQLRKYRTLRKRYASDPDETAEDALRRVEAAAAAAATLDSQNGQSMHRASSQ